MVLKILQCHVASLHVPIDAERYLGINHKTQHQCQLLHRFLAFLTDNEYCSTYCWYISAESIYPSVSVSACAGMGTGPEQVHEGRVWVDGITDWTCD